MLSKDKVTLRGLKNSWLLLTANLYEYDVLTSGSKAWVNKVGILVGSPEGYKETLEDLIREDWEY